MVDSGVSGLVLEELFERADARFLPELLRATAPELALARRLVADPRPWARAQLLAWVDDGCDRSGHRRFMKALLRLAEERRDTELLGHLAHAIDGLIQHKLVTRTRWLWQEQRAEETRVVKLATRAHFRSTPWAHRPDHEPARFSIVTRRYLQRRAVRAFRLEADPARARAIALHALALYTDAALADGAKLLDKRFLLDVCFHGSPALHRASHRFSVEPGHALDELAAAPLRPELWAGDDGTTALLRLVVDARALLVRRFAARLLLDESRRVPAAALLPLVGAPHADVQQLAVRLLERATDLDTLDARTWLALLGAAGAQSAAVLAGLAARALEPHVVDGTLETSALARLCLARAAPVATLAARWLLERKPALDVLLRALDAEVDAVRTMVGDRVQLLLEIGEAGQADRGDAHVKDLVDSRFVDVRALGLRLATDVKFRDSAELWAAFAESPFGDVRAFLLPHLATRKALVPPSSLPALWASTLLSIHGGARGKATALLQLAEHAVEVPDDTERALALLSIALRSTRGPEARAALAALARAAVHGGTVTAQIAARFPELTLPALVDVEVQA